MKKIIACLSICLLLSAPALAEDKKPIHYSDPDLNGTIIATTDIGEVMIVFLDPNDTIEASFKADKGVKGLDCAMMQMSPDEQAYDVTTTKNSCKTTVTNPTAHRIIVAFAVGSMKSKVTGKYSYKLSNADI